jgi:hypothetical protein
MAPTETKVISAYSAKITAQKYLIQLLILLGITGLTYAIDTLIPGLVIDYPEYAGILLVAAPIIEAVRNWLKHRNDTETVVVDTETGIIVDE